MFTIKETASKLKITPNAIRFYEKKGLITPKRGENTYRLYTIEDISRLESIILYRKMGFPLETIQKILANPINPDSSNNPDQSGTPNPAVLPDSTSPLSLFVSQYETLNNHIHTMTKIRECLGSCIEILLNNPVIGTELLKTLERGAELLNTGNTWQDKWEFNQWAADYDKDIQTYKGGLNFYRNYDTVLETAAEYVTGRTVAEIGIGTGNLAGKILEKGIFPGNYIGIDQSVNMLKEARKKCPDIHLKIGTFLQLPLPDHSCDTIVTSYALHHCNPQEKELACEEMDRVLSSHGRIVIADLMFADEKARNAFQSTATKEELADLEDEYFGTVDKLEGVWNKWGYHCKSRQIDELIWVVTAEK